eukprot:7218208-Prymnesium_polylepis.1
MPAPRPRRPPRCTAARAPASSRRRRSPAARQRRTAHARLPSCRRAPPYTPTTAAGSGCAAAPGGPCGRARARSRRARSATRARPTRGTSP